MAENAWVKRWFLCDWIAKRPIRRWFSEQSWLTE